MPSRTFHAAVPSCNNQQLFNKKHCRIHKFGSRELPPERDVSFSETKPVGGVSMRMQNDFNGRIRAGKEQLGSCPPPPHSARKDRVGLYYRPWQKHALVKTSSNHTTIGLPWLTLVMVSPATPRHKRKALQLEQRACSVPSTLATAPPMKARCAYVFYPCSVRRGLHRFIQCANGGLFLFILVAPPSACGAFHTCHGGSE